MNPARKLLTYDALLRHDRPDAAVPELMHGELVYKASPRARHAHTQGAMSGELHRFRGGPGGGWWILVEPDVRFAEHTVLRPDLSGWRADRLAVLPDGPIDVAPDWVGEVLSPGHEGFDRGPKRDAYGAYGVGHLWLISPEARTLEAFALRDGLWVVLGTWSDGQAKIPPFDGVIDVATLFAGEAPPMAHEPAASAG